MRPRLIARAAGESFIGRRMRRTPSIGRERARHRARRRHEADLADPLGAERPLGLGLLDQDDLDLGHVLGAQDADLAQLEGHRHAVLARKLLGQRVAEPHVHRALDLRLALLRVHRAADVVGGDHLLDARRSRRAPPPASRSRRWCGS